MAAVDTNIVTIALPKISESLSSGISLLGWVITGYILATATFLLQSGKIGDKYGKKRVYLLGFAMFGLASALCGLSQNITELVAFRIFQGIGASFLTATTTPLIYESFPPKERGAAIGINSIAWSVGAIAGPVVGGLIVILDWRLIFYINVPIAFAAVAIGSKRIPSRRKAPAEIEKESGRGGINVVSSALLALAVAMILLWLTFFDARFAIIGAISLVALVVNESRTRKPLLDLELRKNVGYISSTVGLVILQIALLGIPFVMSFYFQTVQGYSPLIAGASIAPLPIALALASPLAGRLFDKMKVSAILSIAGAILGALAIIGLSGVVGAQGPPLYIDLFLVLIGIANAFVWTPTISMILKFAKPELRGVANGTAFMLINIGFAASIAIVVAVSASFLPASVVSEIYLGNLGNLTASQAILFNEGIAKALLTLGIIDLLGTPFLLVALRQQRKSSSSAQ